jgi:hypothetical protein
MSISRLGFVSGGGGEGLSEGEVLTLIDQETDSLFTRTQYQSTAPAQNRLTTFEGRLRLQPIPGGADQQVIFPDYRDNYGGSSLRTNTDLNQAELVWQFPSFIRRFVTGNLGGTTVFEVNLAEVGVTYGIMPFLSQEQTSTTPTFQFASSGVSYLGSTTQAMYRVVFTARVGVSTNPAAVKFTSYLQYRTSGGATPNITNSRGWIIRKDVDPQLIYLEYHGAGLAPGNQLNIALYATDTGVLNFYDASFTVVVY